MSSETASARLQMVVAEPAVRFVHTIVAQGQDEIKLLEILPDSPFFVFQDEDLDHVWCLAVHEERFTLRAAVKWLKDNKVENLHADRVRLPSTTLLVNTDALSNDDLNLLSTEFRSTGALLCKWAKGAATLDQAFDALCEQLRSSYGEPNFDGTTVWGRTPVERGTGTRQDLVCR